MKKQPEKCLTKSLSKHRGATLMEVLVTMVIMGVGLLGILSMQSLGLKSNQRAAHITEVQILAANMADEIKSFDSSVSPADIRFNFDTSTDPWSAVDCSAGCSMDDQINRSKGEWAEQLTQALPSGRGRINYFAVPPQGGQDLFRITIMWDAYLTGATGDGCSGNPDVDLSCFSIEVRI